MSTAVSNEDYNQTSNSSEATMTDTTSERPNNTESRMHWTVVDSVKLDFIARWPIINSTDVLEIYYWTTRKAVELLIPDLSVDATEPTYSDAEYDYYPAQLERTKLLPHPFLIQAIQQSRQWQEEMKQWEEKPTNDNRMTRCLTIGLKRINSSRCILLAVLGNCSQS